MKTLKKRLLLLFILGFPIFFPLRSLISGSIPHWFDSAWGLLIALENHEKLRLVGYPGGIPGIFYGPQWYWLIALVQLFNKNPAVITAIILFVPYFTILPFLFYKFKSMLSPLIVALLWLAYIQKYQANSVHLWHIHLAPVIFLAIIYLLITTNWKKAKRGDAFKIFLTGFLTSSLVFIHMSFGSIMFLATSVYIGLQLLEIVWRVKQKPLAFLVATRLLGIFVLGFVISSSPFIIFELRHNFMQIKTITYVLTQSFIYNSAVVGQVGLSPTLIWNTFVSLPTTLLQIPKQLTLAWWLFVFFALGLSLGQNKLHFSLIQKRLLLFSFISSSLLLLSYTSSKNPIWVYHFLGAEMIFVLLLGLLALKSQIFKIFLLLWISWISLSSFISIFTVSGADPLTFESLAAKRFIVESIYKDARDRPFAAFAYSSAIYTFDYDYLFKWLGRDVYHFEPKPTTDEPLVYLIIPPVPEAIKVDFINYKTPPAQYQTEKEWQIPNGTNVIKRVKK